MAVDVSKISEPGIYFITFTNYKWLPLFDVTNSYDAVYKWFDHMRSQGQNIIGYVIMPNHLHVLINYNKEDITLNKLVGNAKRFLAYEIVKRLKEQNRFDILQQLSNAVSIEERKRRKLHEVFQPDFDAKLCYGEQFVAQKLNYMHQNPLRGKWSLCADSASYEHSSAKYYETGMQGRYDVISYNELLNGI